VIYIKKECSMNKLLIVSAFTLTLAACSAHRAPPYEKDKRPEDRDQYSGVEGMKQYQKDQNSLIKQANQIKCQDTRMDFVDAEAAGDESLVRQVKVRLQKYCIEEDK